MNEQIKELAHKAEFINKRHNGDEWRWGYIDPELSAKLEKFAELVQKDVLRKVFASILITDVVLEEKGNTPTSEDYLLAINKDFGIDK